MSALDLYRSLDVSGRATVRTAALRAVYPTFAAAIDEAARWTIAGERGLAAERSAAVARRDLSKAMGEALATELQVMGVQL